MNSLGHGLAPKMKPLSTKRSAIVAALDIGTSKVACLIARLKPRVQQEPLRRRSHAIEILGIGHTRARGIKSGTVVDLAEAEEAVRHAVAAAERMAGVELDSVIASVSAGRLSSELFTATVHVAGPTVTPGDVERVLAAGSRHSLRDGRVVLHSLPIGYALDSARGIRDPRGMLGKRLGVDIHVVTADIAALRNLMLAVEHCHLTVEAMVATPYMAGLAVLADDEADLGAAVIDMGAGTTTIAVFCGGHLVHADGFAVGGHHVTMDLARGLNANIADAERLKTLHGNVLAGVSDDRDVIPVPVERVAVHRRSAWPHHSHRRSQPAHRRCRARHPHPRPAGPDRTPARDRRPAGGRQRRSIRGFGRTPGLSPGGAPRTLRTAANAAGRDRDERLFLTSRTMAPGELLMIRGLDFTRMAGGGPVAPAGFAPR
jgi:cell division protein FtsA